MSIQRRKIDKLYNYFFELINLRNTVAALTTDGDLYCWGYNDYGQVGNGTTDNQLVPNKILENVNHILVDGATKHTQWGQALLNSYKILNSDMRTVEIVY